MRDMIEKYKSKQLARLGSGLAPKWLLSMRNILCSAVAIAVYISMCFSKHDKVDLIG